MTQSKKANEFLGSDNRDIQQLFLKIRQISDFNKNIRAYLPEEMREYCQVANFHNGQLVILTANGSVATQLRFQTVDLLRKIKQDPALVKIKSIQYKVSPGLSVAAGKKNMKVDDKNLAPLSAETADIVKQIAQSIEDEKLREVLERIAKRSG